MAHLHGEKSALIPLIDRLNRYPVGLVDSELLRSILARLFSPAEAAIAAAFPLQEATLAELVLATSVPAARLQPQLETMADKGLIMDLVYGGETYYLLLPGLIGFFELTFMKRRSDIDQAEVARLMAEYLFADPQSGQGREFFDRKTPLTRTLPGAGIPVSSIVTEIDRAEAIIAAAGYGAAGLCYCRHKKEHLGEACRQQAPVEGICISLGSAARFLVRRGFAVEKSREELVAIVRDAQQRGLVQITDNVREKPAFICNCCSCCCELLAGVRAGYPRGVASAGLTPNIDPARCNDCGRCLMSCPVTALSRSAAGIVVATECCLGCGICVSLCPQNAVHPVPGKRSRTPQRKKELYLRMLLEKRRLTPFVLDEIRRFLRRRGISGFGRGTGLT